MTSVLSNLANNLSEGLYRSQCKLEHHDKICKTCEDFLEYTNFKDALTPAREGSGMANLPELIFPRKNCAVGMKLCIYKNYYHNFWFQSNKLHGCADVSIFLLSSIKLSIFHHFHCCSEYIQV